VDDFLDNDKFDHNLDKINQNNSETNLTNLDPLKNDKKRKYSKFEHQDPQ
jgi:hypothetical protein